MPDTFVKIASVTVGSGGASSIDFTSIPSTYTDLVVKYSVRGTVSDISISCALTFNGATTSFSSKFLEGNGASARSGNGGSTNIYAGESTSATATASTFANQEIYIPNYAGSNNKSVSIDSVAETNATTQYMGLQAGLWSSSSAITSIKLAPTSGSYVQYSTATLYGIKNS